MTKRLLIVYYSLTRGNTRRVAETLSRETGANLAEIRTTEPYEGSYEDIVDRGRDEVESGFFPEAEPLEADLDDYDVIALGSPT
ncbi:MAG: flavodoxin [Olsenella sp.]